MEERILDLKKLYDLEINRDTFLLMILHCTNTFDGGNPAYANYLKLEKWQELFSRKPKPNLELNLKQILAFFNYMIKYHTPYFGNSQDIYIVHKKFSNNLLRHADNFGFESIVYYTLNLK